MKIKKYGLAYYYFEKAWHNGSKEAAYFLKNIIEDGLIELNEDITDIKKNLNQDIQELSESSMLKICWEVGVNENAKIDLGQDKGRNYRKIKDAIKVYEETGLNGFFLINDDAFEKCLIQIFLRNNNTAVRRKFLEHTLID